MTGTSILNVTVRREEDAVLARHRARQVAMLLNFAEVEKTSLATVVSELTRDLLRSAGRGQIDFLLRDQPTPALIVRLQDCGSIASKWAASSADDAFSQSGPGVGLANAERLCDEFSIDTAPDGNAAITLAFKLPKTTKPSVTRIAAALTQTPFVTPLQEAEAQNQELLRTLDTVRLRQAEVDRLNGELAETNRGVVALYAELDEKADSLRRASEYKTRFLSDMTHELRTPLNAMVSLSRLLLNRTDGELTSEQEKQVSLIHKSAVHLGEMVNDLLDIAKIEAGRVDLTLSDFDPADVLAGLRGIFRPLLVDSRVPLVIEDPIVPVLLHSDERKLTQILRNLISNALKFTEAGQVTVTVITPDEQTIEFAVADTGIGIADQHQSMIFEDYTQIDSGVQRRVRGTGLGLPLTRKLARLLGGDVTIRSVVGEGSTFVVRLPRRTEPTPAESAEESANA